MAFLLTRYCKNCFCVDVYVKCALKDSSSVVSGRLISPSSKFGRFSQYNNWFSRFSQYNSWFSRFRKVSAFSKFNEGNACRCFSSVSVISSARGDIIRDGDRDGRDGKGGGCYWNSAGKWQWERERDVYANVNVGKFAGEFRVSIVGAVNSGKSSLYNDMLNKLNKTDNRSLVNNIENQCINNKKSVFELDNIQWILTDTIGFNENMIRKVEQWKQHNFDFPYLNNNILKQYFNLIKQTDVILLCIQSTNIRPIDILVYKYVIEFLERNGKNNNSNNSGNSNSHNNNSNSNSCNDNSNTMYNNRSDNNIWVVAFENEKGTKMETGSKTIREKGTNICDFNELFNNFENVLFYPDTYNFNEENGDLFRRLFKVAKEKKQNARREREREKEREKGEKRQMEIEKNKDEEIEKGKEKEKKEENEYTVHTRKMEWEINEGNKTETVEETSEEISKEMSGETSEVSQEQSEELYNVINDSLRIFNPALSEETKKYFYKFINIKKKEKQNIDLFNNYFVTNILKKKGNTLSDEQLKLKINTQADSFEQANEEEAEEEKREVKEEKREEKKQAEENTEKKENENWSDYFYTRLQNNFDLKRSRNKKFKNKRMNLLQDIISKQEKQKLYELLRLSEMEKMQNKKEEEKKEQERERKKEKDIGKDTNHTETVSTNISDTKQVMEECENEEKHGNTGSCIERTSKGCRAKYSFDRDGIESSGHDGVTVCVLGEEQCGKTSLIEAILKDYIINKEDVFELFGKRKYINEDMSIIYKNTKIELLDTCSLRKQHKYKNEDIFAEEEKKVLQNIRKSNICIYIKDVKNNSISLNKVDKKIMFSILKEKKNVIFLINKIDLIANDFEKKRNEFLQSCVEIFYDIPIIFLNTKNPNHIQTLLNKIVYINKMNYITIPTTTLNLFLMQFLKLFPSPWVKKTKCNFKFIKQIKNNPPTFLIFTNLYKKIPNNYLTFFKKKIKKEFDLKYVNIQFVFKTTCENNQVKKNQKVFCAR